MQSRISILGIPRLLQQRDDLFHLVRRHRRQHLADGMQRFHIIAIFHPMLLVLRQDGIDRRDDRLCFTLDLLLLGLRIARRRKARA